MTHELKIWPQYFNSVIDGTKTFEVRENDRGFQKGDSVEFREWNPDVAWDAVSEVDLLIGYTGRKATAKIGYVLPIDEKRVVFSLIEVMT